MLHKSRLSDLQNSVELDSERMLYKLRVDKKKEVEGWKKVMVNCPVRQVTEARGERLERTSQLNISG